MAAQSATKKVLPFVIPQRIERSKTAILQALANTVGVDKTAPHYAFIDDPTTIPTTTAAKRNYFLAKEFGKRAARQLAEEWPTLFMFDRDHPRLEIFRYKKLPALVDVETPTVDMLKTLVDKYQMDEAIRVYEKLRSSKVEVSAELLNDLFKNAAFYNCQNSPPSLVEEWHGLRNYYDDPKECYENYSSVLKLLFSNAEKNAENYSTMICALRRYGDAAANKEAYDLTREMISKKLIPDEDVFIEWIAVSKLSQINQILKEMAQLNLVPSIRTFNVILQKISNADKMSWNEKWKIAKPILGEARRLGLQCTLSTYLNVLKIVQSLPEDNRELSLLRASVLSEILFTLESRDLIEMQSQTDTEFFIVALDAATSLGNDDMVKRIVKLYESKANKVELTALTQESVFYGKYLSYLVNRMRTPEHLEIVYKELIPRVTGVNMTLMQQLLGQLKGFGFKKVPWSFVRRLLVDGLAARHFTDGRICNLYLEMLVWQDVTKMDVTEKYQYEKLVERIVNIYMEYANFTEEPFVRLQWKLSAATIGELSVLLSRADMRTRTWAMLEILTDREKHENIMLPGGRARIEHLMELFEYALDNEDVLNAANCLELISGHESGRPNLTDLVRRMGSRLQINNGQRKILTEFLQRPQQ